MTETSRIQIGQGSTAAHRDIAELTLRLCRAEINPHVQDWEKAGAFPAHTLFKKFGELGLLGITKPTEFGGLGLDYSHQLAFAEALGEARCASVVLALAVQTDMATPALARHGSDALREQFLRPSILGDYVACLGVSEPGAGSDMRAIKTTARREGGDWVINGTKMWTTNGLQADWMCALCVTGEGDALLNKSLICVPLDRPGVEATGPLSTLGMRASDTAQIFFDDVRVPLSYCIGSPGRGLLYQAMAFLEERLFSSASALRMLERAILETADYTRQRHVHGKPLLENQVIQFRLAELQTKIELLRSLVYRAADRYVAKSRDAAQLVAMAKLTTGRLAREVSDACLQYYGGAGYLDETDIARLYRDARLASIGGGADEIMLMIIAQAMGLTQERPGSA